MRRLILLLLLALPACIPCRAQSTGDLIQQLILDYRKLQSMRAILEDMRKGYDIMDKGYTAIRDIAQGRFSLHKTFLDGLLAVSPAVRNDHRIAAILDMEAHMAKEYRTASGRARAGNCFTVSELDGIDRIATAVFNHSLQSIDELTMVITDGTLRMSDAQRLSATDRIFNDINGQLRAIRQLNNETALQVMQRQQAINEIKIIKRLYDNP